MKAKTTLFECMCEFQYVFVKPCYYFFLNKSTILIQMPMSHVAHIYLFIYFFWLTMVYSFFHQPESYVSLI